MTPVPRFDMMTVMILSILCGAVLGMRFKVFILFPAILVSLALNAEIAAAHGSGLWPTLIAIALSVTGLQLGFLGGLSARYFIAASRTPGWRTARRPLHPVVPAE
jgi:predicted lysophospholipase L1 biosynthesis ABC-type transport system permease subunit